MKISTDAVLLGALATAPAPSQILDIGTGTGVIALMLAQRFADAKVQAVELDEDAASQALENIRTSPFSSRMSLTQGRIQDFQWTKKFDLIVSNPPFFSGHLKSRDTKRNKALHTDELAFEELIGKSSQLLRPEGAFWVILPPRQMRDLEFIALKSGLFLFKKLKVQDTENKPVYREVCGFSFLDSEQISETLVLKNDDLTYTAAYSALLAGFLLGY